MASVTLKSPTLLRPSAVTDDQLVSTLPSNDGANGNRSVVSEPSSNASLSSSSSSSFSSTCSSPEVSAPTSPFAFDASSSDVDERLRDLPRLFVFDKDGTLLCFHSMWHPWLQGLIQRIEATSGLAFEDAFNATYGFNVVRQKFQVGLLAEGTMDQCKEGAVRTVANTMGRDRAEEIVNACWEDCDTSSSRTLRLACDAIPLLDALKSRGVKMAMCTADTRKGALGAVDKLGIAHYFDMIVAGGDEDSKPKPDPHNALKICRALGVAPEEALMVGDTRADTQFGKNAAFKLTLGVLSGVGEREHLQKADYILENVEEIFSLFPVLKS